MLAFDLENLCSGYSRWKAKAEGTEMTQGNVDQIGQAETQFEQGYDDRWRDVPYRDDASETWQRGWREANLELSGDDSVEF